MWLTGTGLLTFIDLGEFVATRLGGTIGKSEGHLSGFFYAKEAPKGGAPAYVLEGVYHPKKKGITSAPFALSFEPQMEQKSAIDGLIKFKGSWEPPAGGKSQSWGGTIKSGLDQKGVFGFGGMTNVGNTCYQNSFYSSLFMTPAFRNLLLASPFHESITGTQPSFSFKMLLHPVDSFIKKRDDAPTIAKNLQLLFGALQLMQQPFVDDIADMKESFRIPFCESKQQDAHDFGKHLLDKTFDAFKGTPLEFAAQQTFAGSMASVFICRHCGTARKSSEEQFLDLSGTSKIAVV